MKNFEITLSKRVDFLNKRTIHFNRIADSLANNGQDFFKEQQKADRSYGALSEAKKILKEWRARK